MPNKEKAKRPEDGQCDTCKGCCKFKPGWFKPGEAEKVAEFLKISLEELFTKHLMVDWWEAHIPVFILSPAVTKGSAGSEFPANPKGKCTFFKDGLCSIHPVKPFECGMANHETTDNSYHREAYLSWVDEKHQAQIEKLLGRKPIAAEYSLGMSLAW